jgi:hypothetical protein
MIQWLYRYVFRGIGIVFAIGMITILYLAIQSQLSQSQHTAEHVVTAPRTAAPTGAQR